MLRKRASTRLQQLDAPTAAAAAASAGKSDGAGVHQGLGISTDDLYWLANEQQKQSLRKSAIHRMLSRLNPRRGAVGGPPPAASAGRRKHAAADATAAAASRGDAVEREQGGGGGGGSPGPLPPPPLKSAEAAAASPPARLLPPLADRLDDTSDRAFYLGYAPRTVRDSPPNVTGELLGRHACEVLGAQACHACTAERSRLHQQQQQGRGGGGGGAVASSSFSAAVTIAKATKLRKLFDDRPLRQLQEQLERGEIASGSFLAWRAEKLAAARRRDAADERDGSPRSPERRGGAEAAFARPPRDKRTTFFANLADLREKIRFGVIPSAVVPSEDAKMIELRKTKHADDISAASESFQKIYYSPPLLTVEQQNVQSSFFAGCSAEYSLPPPLPDSLLAAQAHSGGSPPSQLQAST